MNKEMKKEVESRVLEIREYLEYLDNSCNISGKEELRAIISDNFKDSCNDYHMGYITKESYFIEKEAWNIIEKELGL